MTTGTWRGMVATLLLVVGGCTPYKANRLGPAAAQALLPFLEGGKLRRDEVLARLGAPSFESRKDRIVAYRMASDGGGSLTVVPRYGTFGWKRAQYNLVLAFDEEEILETFSLIQMKEVAP